MNCLIWNCQGIVNRGTRHALKLLIQKHKSCLVFLSETHCTKQQHKTLLRLVGLPHIAHFDRVDRAGGLALMWDDSISVQVRDVNRYFIDAMVKGLDNVEWRFTGFYGHPETGQRHVSWDLLRSLARDPVEKWIVVGDFNEILDLGEKSGGRLRSQGQMQAFRQALSDYNLEDMGAAGGIYTWSSPGIKERLDKGTCSPAWRTEFSFSRVVNLHPSRSDHVPILLEVSREPPQLERWRRRFRFEEMWCAHEGFTQKVEEVWSESYNGNPMLQLCRKIRGVGNQLLTWDRTIFRSRREEVEVVRSQLNTLL
ncbi:putative endonuclease/exonuclease/phosphatase [Rosa chinensis]|uniref:Putative endonuclease/exonuclease/phosphatase n=1 Tax=Rosa chinensis TaxID=74649 RepID=A0A2P6QS96_ROSCH|nr:putative endonuclease/exonuclease/phosphatase [Rosa chinensis]